MKKSKFSDEQIVRILQEAAKGEVTQAELCRQHNISENTFYLWKRRYGSMETEDVKRLKELERENAQLKKLTHFMGTRPNAIWRSMPSKPYSKKTVGDQETARRCAGTNCCWYQGQTRL